MPAKSKESRLPKSITPKNWREQVATAIKKRLHPGRGGEDTGGLTPLALKMLARPEMETIIKWLIVKNGEKQFTRFDTDNEGGLDLVDIIRECVFLGKEIRSPEYDLRWIANEKAMADPKRKDLLQEGEDLAFEQMKLERAKRQGRPQDSQMNALMMRHDSRFRGRFGKGKAFHDEIAMLLQITPWMSGATDTYTPVGDRKMTAVAVKKRLSLNRMQRTQNDRLTKTILARREWKLKVRTGAEDSYITISK